MEEACLLCLEINKDILDGLKSDSTKWTELNITNIIEKHFWSLNIQLGSWLCVSCWRQVENFHKFYLRIKEAHLNFGEIKLENHMEFKCKEELPIQKSIKDDSEEEKDRMEFCFIEPEIIKSKTQKKDFTEQEIALDHDTALGVEVEKKALIFEPSDDIPLKQAFKRLRVKKTLACKDPLEKAKKIKRNPKEKLYAEEKSNASDRTNDSKVKQEPLDDANDSNNDCDSINDTDVNFKAEKECSETSESKKQQACSTQRTSRKENDKFIAEHFKQMSCDLCREPFENFPAMQKHFTHNHKQQGYLVCCKRKFFDRTRLVDHLHCHLNPDHFKCNECGKVMSDRNCFDSHMLGVHRANEGVKQHSCDICGKPFIKASVLRIHKLSHLPEEEKKYPCTDCGKKYGSSYLLNQHRQVVHLKRFVKVCYICGKSTNSSAEFKLHMNKHEGIPLPAINCDVCGLRLTSERGLKVHKESQHPIGGKKEHHCPNCPKISPTLKALRKHINTMHKKGYDHKCSICQKGFKRAEALREHMAAHTGTALYTCPWCPKTFNSNGNMHAHRKKIHPKEWEESKLQKYENIVLSEKFQAF